MELKIPRHIGIIVDGNGRWAEDRGLSRSMGHNEGAKNLDVITNYAFKKGVEVLSLYVFSTENFKRDKEEVDYLMNLLERKFKSDFKRFKKEKIRILVSGRREPLPKSILKVLDDLVAGTKEFSDKTINFCINYGGVSEIVDATKKIHNDLNNGIISEVDEDTFLKYLYNDLPPLDLLIRTSGEMRISNFMLYQSAYAEFYFPKTYFPDFLEKDFDLALLEYNNRNRRFGGVNNETKNS